MATYPTYAEAAELAAEVAQDVFADSEDCSEVEAIQRAMEARTRVIEDWDRNRPVFVAERNQH